MFELIALLGSFLKEWLLGQQKLQQAKQDREQAAIETNTQLIRDKDANNSAWEIACLADKDKWLRRISFFNFSFPMFWAAVDPSGVENYFKVALSAMPEWYVKTYIAINGVIWGIASLKNAAPSVVSSVRTAWKNWKDPDAPNEGG